MNWTNVKLIFLRELRDQLRDRRTLFMIAVLPLLLYPLMGMSVFQVQQFLQEQASKVLVVGARCLAGGAAAAWTATTLPTDCSPPKANASCWQLDVVPSRDSAADAWSESASKPSATCGPGKYDAVVYFPPDFAERLAGFRRTLPAAEPDASRHRRKRVPQPEIFYNTASDKSQVAYDRAASDPA